MDKNQINSLEKVLSDEKVMEKILSANSEQDINNILKENNINLKPEEIKLIIDSIKSAVKTVSAEELENISGGKVDKQQLIDNTIKGAGYGVEGGLIGGAIFGGVIAAGRGMVELIRSKGKEGYVKGVTKLIARTACASIAGATAGAAVGAVGGAGATLAGHKIP